MRRFIYQCTICGHLKSEAQKSGGYSIYPAEQHGFHDCDIKTFSSDSVYTKVALIAERYKARPEHIKGRFNLVAMISQEPVKK